MKHDREFWTRHVEGWRASGLTQAAYCSASPAVEGHPGLLGVDLKQSQGKWTALVEVGRTEVKAEQSDESPIELVVQRRYLLRLWPGMEPAHLRDVLSVLEQRS